MKLLSALALVFAAMILLAIPLLAQDTGTPDTLRFAPASATWTINTDADTLFPLELWAWSDQNVKAVSLPFIMKTSTGGGTGHDDSLIVLKDWALAITPNIPAFSFSHIDGTAFPEALHNDYNGALIGLVNLFTPLFPPLTLTQLGTLTIRMLDPEAASCEFDITIDTMFFAPAGTFKFSPDVGTGYPPQFIGPTIHVVNNLCQPPTDPTIGVDPASFNFDAVEGGPNPADQVLNISNIGDGTLNWTVSNSEAWLSLDPASGTDAGLTTLSVDIAGLPAGIYEDTVVVSDPAATNNPVEVPVELIVEEPPPVIVLDPDSFTFNAVLGEGNPPDQNLSITNGGGRTLNWTASDNVSWLSLNPTSGSGDGATAVQVDISSLDSAGTYLATVTVSDPEATNNPQTAAVTLIVTEPPPVIVLDPTSFTFEATETGPNPASQVLNISNGVAGTLHWTAADDADWLTLSPTSGEGDGATTLSVDITGLVPDTYTATITVSDPDAVNNPQTADVTLIVHEFSANLKTVFDPDPAYIYFMFAYDPMMATVYIGDFTDHAPEDVDGTSILVNGTVPAISTMVTTHPDFDGPVLAATIMIAPFLDGYDAVYDTVASDFRAEGMYDDGTVFGATGTVDIIGHSSRNPKQFIIPDDVVVLPGDIDQNGSIDIDDVIMTVGYVFQGKPLPGSVLRADYNCSHAVDLDDIIYLSAYVFTGGHPPCSQ